ncbi:MAG: hypothetical protein ABEK04_03305 [Candidatus Nanohalobium sp.]
MEIRKITPLGRADKILKQELEGLDQEKAEEYEKAFKDYRKIKLAHIAVRILLYAGIITTITATFGIRTEFIAKISSYIGVTFLLILYAGLSYLTMIYREAFYVRRELLISSTK